MTLCLAQGHLYQLDYEVMMRQGCCVNAYAQGLKQWNYCGSRIWIVNTRLFLQPPTTTQMTNDVVVKQIVLFTMLQSLLRFQKSDTLPTTRGHVSQDLNEWLSCNLCGKIHVSCFKAIQNCCTFVQPLRHSSAIKLSLNRFIHNSEPSKSWLSG